MVNLITEHIDIWTAAQTQKNNGGRGRGKISNGQSPHGIKKLRELILELAIRGKLVPQNPNDEPASELLEKIAKEKVRLIKEGKIKKQKKLPEISEDEKPFELPVRWEWVRLGSISQISPRNEAENNLTASFIPMPLISTSHTGEHGQEIKTWGEIKKGYTHFADGDIGVAKITPCFENSKAVVLSGLENSIGAGTTELHIARPFGSTLAPRYILLFLKAPMFLHVGKTKMTGTAGQKRVPKEFFSETPLPLPPLAEQNRIVAKVDELMALCDHLEQQQTDSNDTHQILVETLLATLTNATDLKESAKAWQRIANHFDTLFTNEQSIDQLKQTILQLAVMGKLVPQDLNDEPVKVLLGRIAKEKARLIKEGKIKKQKILSEISEDEKPFELPPRWEWGFMPQAVTHDKYAIKRGPFGSSLRKSYFVPSGYKVYEQQNAINDDFSVGEYYVDKKKFNELKAFEVVPNNIIISCSGTVGKVAVAPSNMEPGIINQALLKLSLNESVLTNDYFKILFPAFYMKTETLSNLQGTAQKNMVSVDTLKKEPFPLPPLSEQHRIVAKVDELMALSDTLKARLNNAQTTQVQLADSIVEQAVA